MTEIAFPPNLPFYANQIEKALPHRYPFLLVDRILALSGGQRGDRKGRKIHAIKNITMNENHFPGHFPGNPVFPGVLTIEALAQASALSAYDPDKKTQGVYIAAVNNAKFRAPVIPGDTLHLYSECIKDRGSMIVFKTEAIVEDKKVAEAELWAKIF